MISLEALKVVFGEDAEKYFQYLEHKNKGGFNNSKGHTYENFFAVYEIAKSFNRGMNPDGGVFSSQVFCFVDDFVIEIAEERKNWHYQIKDVQVLNWNSKTPNSLKEDFLRQRAICSSEGVEAVLRLVVSNKKVYERLRSTKPEDIGDLVGLVHFETAPSLNSLIRKNPLFREELTRMCALKNPSTNKLEALAAIILGAWDSTDKKKVSLRVILDKCYSLNPHYMRGFNNKISNKLADIFNGIEQFSYIVEGGLLQWKFGLRYEGNLSCRIGSQEYEQWENDIFNASIKTFEDLEPFLA